VTCDHPQVRAFQACCSFKVAFARPDHAERGPGLGHPHRCPFLPIEVGGCLDDFFGQVLRHGMDRRPVIAPKTSAPLRDVPTSAFLRDALLAHVGDAGALPPPGPASTCSRSPDCALTGIALPTVPWPGMASPAPPRGRRIPAREIGPAIVCYRIVTLLVVAF
jgi:hypothetical protein